MRKIYWLFIYIFLLGSVWSCKQFTDFDNIDTVRYQGEYAIPLVNTQLSMRDVLPELETNSTITIDPDGLLRLHYEGDVISQSSDDVFANINAQLPPIIPVTSKRMALSFNTPDGLQIDHIIFKAGALFYAFQSKESEAMNVNIRFPQIKKEGEMLEFDVFIGPYFPGNNPPTTTNAFNPASLAGYELITEQDSIYIEYEALKPDGEPGVLESFFIRLQDLAFFYAEGFLGTLVFEGGRDTISIDFFDDWIQGDIFFEEPKITYYLENGFGLPTRSIINVMEVQTVKGDILPFESEVIGLGKGVDFDYPSLNEVGEIKTTVFTFNKDNSNITEILGAGPTAIDYEVNALTNPDSNLAVRGFITDSSYYKVRMEVDLPMYGKVANFEARDTINISLENWQDVIAAEFKIVAENNSPLDVIVQGYFMSPFGVRLDSLLAAPQRLITGAPVNQNGNVTQSVEAVNFAPFPAENFERIKDADRIVISATFASTNNGSTPVKVYADQDVKIRVGAKVEVGN